MFFFKATRMQHVLPGLLITAAWVGAQTHFTFTPSTGNNMTVIVQASIKPMVNGQPLVAGDEIGVCTPSGLCVGARIWDGVTNRSIAVWGDNDQTPTVDGARVGEALSFKVWDASLAQEFMVAATYDTVPPATSRGTYGVNGIAIVKSLGVLPLPATPILVSPVHGSTGLSISPTLVWNASSGATAYHLQVSIDSLFSTAVFSDTSLTATQKQVNLPSRVPCYWRVKAKNANGYSAWSTVWRFSPDLATHNVYSCPVKLALPSGPSTAFTLSGRVVSERDVRSTNPSPRNCLVFRNGDRAKKNVLPLSR